MPNAPGKKAINIVVHRDLFAAIERAGASTGATPSAFARAAVEAALKPTPRPAPESDGLADLAVIPLADLLDELRARVERAAVDTDLLARATAAEAKLAAIAGVIVPAGAGA